MVDGHSAVVLGLIKKLGDRKINDVDLINGTNRLCNSTPKTCKAVYVNQEHKEVICTMNKILLRLPFYEHIKTLTSLKH